MNLVHRGSPLNVSCRGLFLLLGGLSTTGIYCAYVERISLDANILIHAIDKDADKKQRQAIELIETCALTYDCVLTLQSLAKFYFAATRKEKVSSTEAKWQISDW